MRISALMLFVLTAASCYVPANAATKVFKWTDANGQVHFSSSPPPGQATEKVRIRRGVDAPPAAPTDAATTPASAKSPDTEKNAMSPQQRAELSTYCAAMRVRLNTFKQGGLIVEKELDGKSVPLGAAAIAQKLSADETSVRTYCTVNGL